MCVCWNTIKIVDSSYMGWGKFGFFFLFFVFPAKMLTFFYGFGLMFLNVFDVDE